MTALPLAGFLGAEEQPVFLPMAVGRMAFSTRFMPPPVLCRAAG